MQQTASQQILVEVDKGARNVRMLYAGIDIDAPVAAVWQALTDYEGLGNFIPGKTDLPSPAHAEGFQTVK